MELKGRVVLITGASEGIGAACARAFRARGAHVSLVARSSQGMLEAGGPDAVVTSGDLTDAAVREQAVQATVERFGTVDVLVNNAGRGLYAPATRSPLTEVRQMFELNLFSLVGMTELVAPLLRRQRRGMVVNISSIAGKVTLPWFALYSASKYGVCSYGEALRMELRGTGVGVMTVCPGYVSTHFQENVLVGRPPTAVQRSRMFKITPEQCADAIVRGVTRDARTVVVPRLCWLLVAAQRVMPGLVEARLARLQQDYAQAEGGV